MNEVPAAARPSRGRPAGEINYFGRWSDARALNDRLQIMERVGRVNVGDPSTDSSTVQLNSDQRSDADDASKMLRDLVVKLFVEAGDVRQYPRDRHRRVTRRVKDRRPL